MKKKTQLSAYAGLYLLAGALLVLTGIFLFRVMGASRLPVLGEPGHVTGSFSFTNQDGKTITDKEVAGKIRVVEYFFTTCKGICPKMGHNLVAVYKAIRNRQDAVILSHTVDPEKDSVPVLKNYASMLGASGDQWQFFTGDKYALYKAAEKDYLLTADSVSSASIETEFVHTQYVTLVDKQNRIRGFYDATDSIAINRLIADIAKL